MNRRGFLKSSGMLAAAGIGAKSAQGRVWTHNWGKYDFGSGPPVSDRLNQGPFPQYQLDAMIPPDQVVMTTTPFEEVVPNYGKGLVTYITADMGTTRSNLTIFLMGDRGVGSIFPWAEALRSPNLARNPAAPGALISLII